MRALPVLFSGYIKVNVSTTPHLQGGELPVEQLPVITRLFEEKGAKVSGDKIDFGNNFGLGRNIAGYFAERRISHTFVAASSASTSDGIPDSKLTPDALKARYPKGIGCIASETP